MTSREATGRLENVTIGRLLFHPTGYRDFCAGMAEALDLGEGHVTVGKVVGTFKDATKYLLYGTVAGTLIYQNVISQMIA